MRFHRYNPRTHEHEVREITAQELRLAHLRKRLRSWTMAVWDISRATRVRFVFVRTSYRPGVDWMPEHISDCLRRLAVICGPKLLAYAWVAELQARGAVHYHICLVLAAGTYVPMFDQVDEKLGMKIPLWPHGSSHMDFDRHPSHRYLMKYGEKSEQKRDEFPKGLRLHATVIRTSGRELIPPRSFLFWKLSAAVAVVQHTILSIINDFPASPEWFLGWRWHVLPGGDWAIYRKDRLWQVVHSEWWCEDYPPRKPKEKKVPWQNLSRPKPAIS